MKASIKNIFRSCLAAFAVFLLFQGFFVLLAVGADLFKPLYLVPERKHTKYDDLLGWVNLPNFFASDAYGPGVSLRINSQGFRSDHDFAPVPAFGKKRLICLGDSFTFGYGVSDGKPWCDELCRLDPGLETVNMGQGGYGVDQAYLWYLRDGTRLKHDGIIFSLITDDIWRMGAADYHGYGKPLLKIEKGKLVASNIPVPRRFYRFPSLEKRIERLGSLEPFRRLGACFPFLCRPKPKIAPMSDEEERHILTEIFRGLAHRSREAGNRLILIYLPMQDDRTGKASDPWRAWFKEMAARENITYYDFVEELKGLSDSRWRTLFGPHAHYSDEGNRLIARMIYDRSAWLWNERPGHPAT